ncbi:MAG: RrF2 family transcriptional regulator [Qingshengfaniella sp.]
MRLPETVEWGLHACLALSMLPEGRRIPARHLAEYHGLKSAYLAKVMGRLATAGLVRSVEGRAGGLLLARPPDKITMLDIVDAIEGGGGFFQCTGIRQNGPCAAQARHYRTPCKIAGVMARADAAWRQVLAGTSLADLMVSVAADPVPGVAEATRDWLARTGALR